MGRLALTLTAPAAPHSSLLTLSARTGGRHVSGSPLVLRYRPPVAWDGDCGDAGLVISGDGATLTTTDRRCSTFRCRSTVVHTGPGVRLDIGVQVATGPSGITCSCSVLALGAVKQLVPHMHYCYSSNPGVAFLYNMVYGGVNTDSAWGSLYTGFRAPNTVHRIVLHVRGTTLTFSAGPEGGPLTPQAGSWPLPPDFYLLTCLCYAGISLTLSIV